MPGTPRPIIHPLLGVVWGSVFQALQNGNVALNNLASQAQQDMTQDSLGNMTSLRQTNLNMAVPLGSVENTANNTPVSGFSKGQVPAAWVGTGLTGSGICVPTAVATGLITLTEGSTSATLDSPISGTFTSGQTIGAYTYDAATGVTQQAIFAPVTTFTISGTAITLSHVAALGGSGLYCVAATCSKLT